MSSFFQQQKCIQICCSKIFHANNMSSFFQQKNVFKFVVPKYFMPTFSILWKWHSRTLSNRRFCLLRMGRGSGVMRPPWPENLLYVAAGRFNSYSQPGVVVRAMAPLLGPSGLLLCGVTQKKARHCGLPGEGAGPGAEAWTDPAVNVEDLIFLLIYIFLEINGK